MLNEIFRLFGTIAINNDEANKAIDKTNTKASKLHTAMDSAFSKIGKAASVCGKAIVTGLGAGAAAMGTLVVKSMGLAGELEQNMGGSEAVFKHHAQRMQNEAAQAFKTMGLSQSEYLQSANKMGALFQGMGYSTADSVDMTINAMQRAADVASIMGISQEEAMEAVNGMAKGNFTMMDNLGVAMNDTALAAYAVEKGITKSVQSMSTNEKIALAYQMFMEQSAYAAGNYAKENDTLAGSLSTAKAAWTNFLSGSDTVYAPKAMADMVDAFVNVGDVVIKNLNKLLPKLTKGLTTLIQRLTPYIPEMLQAVLPGLIAGAVALITGLAEALPGIVEVLADILPETLEQVVASLDQIFPALVAAVTSIISALVANLPTILSSIGAALRSWAANGFWPLIQELFRIVFGVELPSWEDMEKSISAGWKQIEASIRDFFQTKFGITLPSWEDVRNGIVAWWTRFKNKIGEYIKAVFSLDFSDQDKDGVPWYTRIGKWFIDVMAGLGGMLLALVGIDAEEMAKRIDAEVEKIKAWWEEVTKNLDLTVVWRLLFGGSNHQTEDEFKEEAAAQAEFVPIDTSGKNRTDWMVQQQNENSPDFDTTWEEYAEKYGIPHKNGLDFVPRDNYLARLHYGESVLTKEEATAWRNGQASGIDYDRLAEAMAQRPMAFNIDGKAFAVMLARELSRTIGNRNIQSLMAMGG